MKTSRNLAATVAAVLLSVAACTDQQAATELRAVTAAEEDLLYQAEQLLTRDCMRSAGFDYWVTPRNPVPENRDFPYVVDDVAWATQYGYGTSLRRKLDQSPNRHYFESLSEDRKSAAVRALNGDRPEGLTATLPNGIEVQHSDQGCTSEAQRELYGDLPAWYRTIKVTENLFGERVGRTVSDERYPIAVTSWSRCMRAKGHRYGSPDETGALFTADNPPPSSTELKLAVAEATCANSTPLASTAEALDREADAALREQYRGPIAEQQRLQLAALPRAQTIVDRG